MKKFVNALRRGGVVANDRIASWCFISDINKNEIVFISDAKFKKGEKINIQLSKNKNNTKESLLISGVIRKKATQISGGGNLNYAWVC